MAKKANHVLPLNDKAALAAKAIDEKRTEYQIATERGLKGKVLVAEELMALRAVDHRSLSPRKRLKLIGKEIVAMDNKAAVGYEVVLKHKLARAVCITPDIHGVLQLTILIQGTGMRRKHLKFLAVFRKMGLIEYIVLFRFFQCGPEEFNRC